MSPRCTLLIVMGVTDPEAQRYRRQSMILVPKDTPGVNIQRSTSLFGYDDGPHGGHAEIVYDNVRVPPPTCSARRATGSGSPRNGLVRAGSTTPCARSGWPSARSR